MTPATLTDEEIDTELTTPVVAETDDGDATDGDSGAGADEGDGDGDGGADGGADGGGDDDGGADA